MGGEGGCTARQRASYGTLSQRRGRRHTVRGEPSKPVPAAATAALLPPSIPDLARAPCERIGLSALRCFHCCCLRSRAPPVGHWPRRAHLSSATAIAGNTATADAASGLPLSSAASSTSAPSAAATPASAAAAHAALDCVGRRAGGLSASGSRAEPGRRRCPQLVDPTHS